MKSVANALVIFDQPNQDNGSNLLSNQIQNTYSSFFKGAKGSQRAGQTYVLAGEKGTPKSAVFDGILNQLITISTRHRSRQSVMGRGPQPDDLVACGSNILNAFCDSDIPCSTLTKHVKVHFDCEGSISGAKFEIIGLESWRILERTSGQMAFMVFYELLAGADSSLRKRVHLKPIEEYNYLKADVTPQHSLDFGTLRAALETLEVANEEIWALLSAILLLGNLTFTSTGSRTSSLTDDEISKNVCELLKIEHETLQSLLCTQPQCAPEPHKLNKSMAEDRRDLFAVELYERLVNWLVREVNEVVHPQDELSPFVGILLPPGFQNLEQNDFEELCGNICDERLRQFCGIHLLKSYKNMFQREGIQTGSVEELENETLLEVLASESGSVLQTLERQLEDSRGVSIARQIRSRLRTPLVFPNKLCMKKDILPIEYEPFRNVIPAVNGDEPITKRMLKSIPNDLFYVLHSVNKPVRYHLSDVKMKNLCSFSPNHHGLGDENFDQRFTNFAFAIRGKTKEPFLSKIFETVSGQNVDFVGFASNLNMEFNKILASIQHPRVVYCIASTPLQDGVPIAQYIQRQYVDYGITNLEQLESNGFLKMMSFKAFAVLFAPLLSIKVPDMTSQEQYRSFCEQLIMRVHEKLPQLQSHGDRELSCQIGKTLVFLQPAYLKTLELCRNKMGDDVTKMAMKLQSLWRMRKVRRWYLKVREAIVRFQAHQRGRKYRQMWIHRIEMTKRLQTWYRCQSQFRQYQETRDATIRIQAWFRSAMCRQQFERRQVTLSRVRDLAKAFSLRRRMLIVLNAILTLQQFVRKFLERNRRYWSRVRGALLFQAAWRGHCVRHKQPDIVQWLQIRRVRRAKERFLRRVFAWYKGELVRRRYRKLRHSVRILQTWWRGILQYRRFQLQRSVIVRMQSVVRGFLARVAVNKLRTKLMLEEEQWRIQQLREMEALQITEVTELTATALHNSRALPIVPSSTMRVLDVDIMKDISDVFPHGIAGPLGRLHLELMRKGKKIVDLKSGDTHLAALSSEGKVYTWGWSDFGQLGHGGTSNQDRPRLLESLHFSDSNCRGAIANDVVTIKQIACGKDHTIALTDSGRCLTWGQNTRGQLGQGASVKSSLSPHVVDTFRRNRMKQIACGDRFTLALNNRGTVYGFGAGKFLGLGAKNLQRQDQPIPSPLVTLKVPIKKVSCGAQFSIVVAHNSMVFSWGDNRFGQLGLGHREFVDVPTKVTKLCNLRGQDRIVDVDCGPRHALALSGQRRVWSWGWNKFGQLGNGDMGDQVYPARLKFPNNEPIQEIHCGYRQSVAVTTTNKVFAWGCIGAVECPASDEEYVNVIHNPATDNTQWCFLCPKEVPNSGRRLGSVVCCYSDNLSVTCCQMHTEVDPGRLEDSNEMKRGALNVVEAHALLKDVHLGVEEEDVVDKLTEDELRRVLSETRRLLISSGEESNIALLGNTPSPPMGTNPTSQVSPSRTKKPKTPSMKRAGSNLNKSTLKRTPSKEANTPKKHSPRKRSPRKIMRSPPPPPMTVPPQLAKRQ